MIAVPIGAWIGHTGRGGFLVVGLANGLRALPTLGLLVLLVGADRARPASARSSRWSILAVPPILAGTYAGVRNVDPAVVDAARGMGMRGREVLLARRAAQRAAADHRRRPQRVLQVISTATIAAYVALGGLGRYIIDGLALRDFPQMIAGSLLVALLAIVADLLLAGLQKLIVSPGLQAVPRRGPRRLRAVPTTRPAAAARGLSP